MGIEDGESQQRKVEGRMPLGWKGVERMSKGRLPSLYRLRLDRFFH